MTIHRMCQTIVHRGPDDEGIFVKDGAGLGMRRLSIIDLAGGHQPVFNEDRTAWVVFNGEIYNFRELRRELEQKGHRFYTHTDTEVIVHLYEDLGAECVHKLRGMFAFALLRRAQPPPLAGARSLGQKANALRIVAMVGFCLDRKSKQFLPQRPNSLPVNSQALLAVFLFRLHSRSCDGISRRFKSCPPGISWNSKERKFMSASTGTCQSTGLTRRL